MEGNNNVLLFLINISHNSNLTNKKHMIAYFPPMDHSSLFLSGISPLGRSDLASASGCQEPGN